MSNGYPHNDLLAIQKVQLAMWKDRLRPDLFKEVSEYVRSHNNRDTNFVLRGQDIVQVIMDWPNLSPAFPPRIQPETQPSDII